MGRYVIAGPHPGLLRPGNIDIIERAFVAVPFEGGFASVHSVSYHLNPPELRRYGIKRPSGAEVLIPTVIRRGGKWVVVHPRGALAHYQQTHRHLGIFDTPAHATQYAIRLHEEQAREGVRIRERQRIRGIQ